LHLWLREQRIEAHQALADLPRRDRTSMQMTGLADGLEKPATAHVIEASTVARARGPSLRCCGPYLASAASSGPSR
jgi:hypothetical protein